MNLKYRLNQHDFLQQVLYYHTTSKNSKKRRLKAWLFVILFILFSNFLLAYLFANKISAGHFFGGISISILGILLYPYFYKKIIKKQLSQFVNENYKSNFGKEYNLTFNKDVLEINTTTGESKINYSSLEKITEISSHFFLILNNGSYIIIPKSKTSNIESVRTKLKTLSTENKILHSTELDWKWK